MDGKDGILYLAIIETRSQALQLEGEAVEEAVENQLVENSLTNDDSSNACTS